MHPFALTSALLVLALAACAADSDAPRTPESPSEATQQVPTVMPPSSIGTSGAISDDVIARAITTAAQETGVAESEIVVVTAEAVTWSDGSLGCPQPGMAYTQALVPGYRVTLQVAGEESHYHAGRDGEFFRCSDPEIPSDDGRVDR